MPEPTLTDIQQLMTQLAYPFYQTERDSIPPVHPRRFENDVEHSWSVGFLACSLAPEIDPNLDLGKIAQYALVHDLVEVFAGDTTPWEPQHRQDSKEQRETQALNYIQRQFPRFPWIARTIRDYETHASPEAAFVWAVYKLLPPLMRYLDRGRFYIENGITQQILHERTARHRRKAHAHPKIGEYYDQIFDLLDQHPEFFAPSNPTQDTSFRTL